MMYRKELSGLGDAAATQANSYLDWAASANAALQSDYELALANWQLNADAYGVDRAGPRPQPPTQFYSTDYQQAYNAYDSGTDVNPELGIQALSYYGGQEHVGSAPTGIYSAAPQPEPVQTQAVETTTMSTQGNPFQAVAANNQANSYLQWAGSANSALQGDYELALRNWQLNVDAFGIDRAGPRPQPPTQFYSTDYNQAYTAYFNGTDVNPQLGLQPLTYYGGQEHIGYQQPAAPVQQPAAPVQQQPPAPVQPAAPVQQQPAAPVQQQPAAPVQQQPATPVQQQPAAPVQQQPAGPIMEPQPVPVQQQPARPTTTGNPITLQLPGMNPSVPGLQWNGQIWGQPWYMYAAVGAALWYFTTRKQR